MTASAQCASGARSPEQPSEPYSCTTGAMPALSSAAYVCATTGRTPVRPVASVDSRSSMSARTTSGSTSGPDPAAWLRISERWRSRAPVGRDLAGRQRAEAGRDAVVPDGVAGERVDDRARRLHRRHRVAGQRDRRVVPRDRDDLGRGERRGADAPRCARCPSPELKVSAAPGATRPARVLSASETDRAAPRLRGAAIARTAGVVAFPGHADR